MIFAVAMIRLSMRFLLITALMFTMAAAMPASAQDYKDYISLFELRSNLAAGRGEVALMNAPNAEEFIRNYSGPKEPVLPRVTFLDFDRPGHLQGQIESLVHGITIGLPPEYDHYGYELRRYMKSVGNFDIYKNNISLQEQKTNIAKAQIIFKHWRHKLNTDMRDIANRIRDENGDSKARTTFKLNAGLIKAFMIEMQSWLNANEALLQFLDNSQGAYRLDGGEIGFESSGDRAMFASLYAAREKARQQIYKYDPFRIVVY